VPMIMMSSHIAAQTIVQEDFDHTSFLYTMSKKWNFEHLTDRDANAVSFKSVFNHPERRDWPDLPHIDWPVEPPASEYQHYPLNDLQKAVVKIATAYALDKDPLRANALKLTLDAVKGVDTVGDAVEILKNVKKILYDL